MPGRARRATRVCSTPGCADLTDHPSGLCDDCRAARYKQADAARPSSAERGYGPAHQQLRREWAPRVEAGGVNCTRCGILIVPGTAWDLGHDDNDRSRYTGPEHQVCNRATRGR
jgi:hypothetical protein